LLNVTSAGGGSSAAAPRDVTIAPPSETVRDQRRAADPRPHGSGIDLFAGERVTPKTLSASSRYVPVGLSFHAHTVQRVERRQPSTDSSASNQ